MEKSSDFHGPGEEHGLFGEGRGSGGLRVGLAELNPAADADVVEDLEEPLDFRRVEPSVSIRSRRGGCGLRFCVDSARNADQPVRS